ncbi:peroxisomal dehydratase protein [Rutstroemia sp. NJR-2017a BVV2]|nr:peroxisomal dehydratase protein [Rutstroemia sp. NJR-2017a BVV2]
MRISKTSEPGVGFEYPPVKVTWNKRDLLLFAYSIGCTADELHFLYEKHPKFQPFPTYPIVLSFKTESKDTTDFRAIENALPSIPGVPHFSPLDVVDGSRSFKILKPLPLTSDELSGSSFSIHKTVLGVYDKGNSGSVLKVLHRLIDDTTGDVYVEIVVTSFYIGRGNWGGPRGPKNFEMEIPNREPDAVERIQTNKESSLLYRLNGDYNPLHAEPEQGKQMGFGGVILHGLVSWNLSAHVILKAWGGSDGMRMSEFEARFRKPVRPGDGLVVEMWKGEKVSEYGEGWWEVKFRTRKADGEVVLSGGRAVIKLVDDSEVEGEKITMEKQEAVKSRL